MITTRSLRTILTLGLLCAGLLPGSVGAEQSKEKSASAEIRSVLEAQVAAWNHGDLETFMMGYWHSPELTFFSNAAETKGWEPTLERYKRSYQSGGHAMGVLDFPALQITVLSADAAFVRGQFHLKMPDGKEPHGMFTLVLRNFPQDGWKIIHDHSSGE